MDKQLKKSAWQMEITEADLEYGVLLKETDNIIKDPYLSAIFNFIAERYGFFLNVCYYIHNGNNKKNCRKVW